MSAKDAPPARNRRPALNVFEYTLGSGLTVLAGKTDADNERLSLKVARPNDWWFHVRGMPGSHVILQVAKGEEVDKEALREAAAVAAYHSKARGGGTVAVSYTRARFVTKARGEPVGTVEIRRDQVLKVRPALPEAAR